MPRGSRLAAAVLELQADLAPELRQQMLTIAMAGAAANGDRAAVESLERRFGRAFSRHDPHGKVRRFIAAWTQGSH